MSKRLSEIKDLLSKTSSKDIKSLSLYKEALSIFVECGKTEAAAKCKDQIRKLELHFQSGPKGDEVDSILESKGKENAKSTSKSTARKQSSISTWTVKANSMPSAPSLSLSSTLALLKGKDSLKSKKVEQTSRWHELPIELFIMIARYLSDFDLYKFSLSCSDLKTKLQSNANLWRFFDWTPFAKRLRNETLEMLYSLTKGECKSFILKDAASITSSVFQKISKGKFPARKLEEFHIQSNSKVSGIALLSFLSQKSLIKSLTKVCLIDIRELDDKSVSAMISQLENVKEWNLSNCHNLTDASISKVQKKSLCIEAMIIRHCSFTDSFVHHLVNLASKTLKILDFYDCKSITKQALVTLSKCNQLSRLEFSGINNKWPSNLDLDDAILILTQSNPNIQGFQWRNCPFIRDTALTSIAEFCPLLDVLVLDCSANISDAGYRSLALSTPNLQVLSLKACPRLSASVFSLLIKQTGHSWVKVDFSTNYWFDDDHLLLIAQHCPNILSISLSGVPKITSMGLHKFIDTQAASSRLNLKELILWNNPHLSNDSINRLRTFFGSKVVSVLEIQK